MSYVPNETIALDTLQQLRDYVRRELREIAREFGETTALDLRTTNVEPGRPRDGMIVAADGTNWDPGSGAGIYAYVGGAWIPLGANAQLATFSANKNGTDQTGITSNDYVKVTFGTEEWDVGAFYDAGNSLWTPPAGLVMLIATVLVSAAVVDERSYIVAIYKNGSLIREAYHPSSGADASVVPPNPSICVLDEADGTDYYEVYVWLGGSGAGDKTIDGGSESTYFQGHLIRAD